MVCDRQRGGGGGGGGRTEAGRKRDGGGTEAESKTRTAHDVGNQHPNGHAGSNALRRL